MNAYPIKLKPIYKARIWGGKNLETLLNKEIPSLEPIGETWELSCREGDESIISNGVLEGLTLNHVLQQYGNSIIGTKYEVYMDRFPLLIKFIDAKEKLSIQVHPDDQYALAFEGDLGKTEAWYIVDAKEDSKIIYGLKDHITKKDFISSLENGSIEDTLNEIHVKAGDIIFIPAGTVHAIGEGIVIFEVQQNSDVTYRLYDWQRVGLDGKARELHIDKALDVIDFDSNNKKIVNQKLSCHVFTIEEIICVDFYMHILPGDSFEILTFIEGTGEIEYGEGNREHAKAGDTILLPASLGRYKIVGYCKLLKTYIN